MKTRGFEVITAYRKQGIRLPTRRTGKSAGYDLEAAETIKLAPHKITMIPTGLKAYMEGDEVLLLFVRSSLAVSQEITLANNVGVIDADYYDSEANEGHIMVPLINNSKNPLTLAKGTRICQGIFVKYQTVDGDEVGEGVKRQGGFGSTGN
ncbi:MAG: dUTP diphosphatase [Selenomonadaceae bacterium]|nr:dUTP diphosphatase [Selenomonadaceae bacterium]